MKKFPKIGDYVRVFNPQIEEWMEGTCAEHLSTQWVLDLVNNKGILSYSMVIHPSWRWK